MKRAILTLALLAALAPIAPARVLVVVEKTSSYIGSGADNTLNNIKVTQSVQRILETYGRKAGEDFVVLPGDAVNTYMCRTGIVQTRSGVHGFIADSPADTFDAVIHVGFNGGGTSSYAAYRPDSITVTAKYPTVPQLMLFDMQGCGDSQDFPCGNTTTDSNWVDAPLNAPSSGGSADHDGESTYFVPGRTERAFPSIAQGRAFLKAGQPTGGLRSLLCSESNNYYRLMELSEDGAMVADPMGISAATEDTVMVWEKLNQHINGAARIVFANVSGQATLDSTDTVFRYDKASTDWPVLLFAMAHLGSLTGGAVLGYDKTLDYGYVMVGGGTRSDRRHPGGIWSADTTILAASGDSVATTNAKVVIAADPESLAVNAGDIAILKRFGQVRFTPWVRVGLDTAVAGLGDASTDRPVDVWGRYRNRAILGDSLRHAVAGEDTSFAALYAASYDDLKALVGEGLMSRLMVAPDFDWSPFQMREGANAGLLDSLAYAARELNMTAILANTRGLDMLPNYLTNPLGWVYRQGPYSIRASDRRGERIHFIGHDGFTVRGSQVDEKSDGLSFMGFAQDSAGPFNDPTVYPHASHIATRWFWYSLFGPDDDDRDGAGGNVTFEGVTTIHDYSPLYGISPARVFVLPAQAFGGQDASAPNRWGFWAIKSINGMASLINYKAGRTVMRNVWPEDIRP